MNNNMNENMPDLSEIITKLTSDPAMMQQISKIAETFKSPAASPDADIEEVVETMARRPHPIPDNRNNKNSHFNVDNHTQLFKALRPYLNAERKETLEYIVQLFSVIKLLEMSGLNIGNLLPSFNTASSASRTNEISEE